MRLMIKFMRLVEAVGKRLDNILKERKMKQNHLATLGGIPRSTISIIIGVKRKEVKLGTIYQICDTLKIPLKEFFDDPIFNEVTD